MVLSRRKGDFLSDFSYEVIPLTNYSKLCIAYMGTISGIEIKEL